MDADANQQLPTQEVGEEDLPTYDEVCRALALTEYRLKDGVFELRAVTEETREALVKAFSWGVRQCAAQVEAGQKMSVFEGVERVRS